MESPWHPLRILLHDYLALDSLVVVNLPHVVAGLSADALAPSPHSQKWTARINSLLHSKESGLRWAGLCLALRTTKLSMNAMMESALGWVTVALPMLSVRGLVLQSQSLADRA